MYYPSLRRVYSVCLSLSFSLFLLPHLSHSEQLSYRFKLAIQFLNLLWSIFECRQHQKSKLQNKFIFFWRLKFLPNSNFSLLSEGRKFLLGQKFLPNFFQLTPFYDLSSKWCGLKSSLAHSLSLYLFLNAHTHASALSPYFAHFNCDILSQPNFFSGQKSKKQKKE